MLREKISHIERREVARAYAGKSDSYKRCANDQKNTGIVYAHTVEQVVFPDREEHRLARRQERPVEHVFLLSLSSTAPSYMRASSVGHDP